MRGPRQTGYELTLTIAGLLVIVVAVVWLIIDSRSIWLLIVSSLGMALGQASQFHYDRRLGRSGRTAYSLFVGMVTLGLFQSVLLTLSRRPSWIPALIAGFAVIVVALAVALWKKVLRYGPAARPPAGSPWLAE